MAIFGFLKKKQEELPMPPPPPMPAAPEIQGDIEEIRPTEIGPEPEIPELPPALPAPEIYKKPAEPAWEKEEEKIEVRPPLKPTFVAIEDYKRIINDTNTIRAKLMEAENFVRKLGDLKNEEERAFEKWRTQLEDVEKKLGYVDQLIAKAER
ncbi:hypothetical protein KY309_03190 [Candidatus Woesearchaeota archaeon]|nr:hypothetical protein [Candidatus Woesearchaeota archaeon]MBW3016591.1 hypothetical protein [Candidatus Woesearchaeota archaeon]